MRRERPADGIPQPVVVEKFSRFSIEIEPVGVGSDQVRSLEAQRTQAHRLDLDQALAIEAIGVAYQRQLGILQGHLLIPEKGSTGTASPTGLRSYSRPSPVAVNTVESPSQPPDIPDPFLPFPVDLPPLIEHHLELPGCGWGRNSRLDTGQPVIGSPGAPVRVRNC